MQPFRRESNYKEISRGRRRLLGVLCEISATITVFLAILAAGRSAPPAGKTFHRFSCSKSFHRSSGLSHSPDVSCERLFGFFWLLIDLRLLASGLPPRKLRASAPKCMVQIVETHVRNEVYCLPLWSHEEASRTFTGGFPGERAILLNRIGFRSNFLIFDKNVTRHAEKDVKRTRGGM